MVDQTNLLHYDQSATCWIHSIFLSELKVKISRSITITELIIFMVKITMDIYGLMELIHHF